MKLNDRPTKKTSNSTGPDGGQFDYVDVFTQVHGYRCYFSKFLDNGDNELGHDCHQTAWIKNHTYNYMPAYKFPI